MLMWCEKNSICMAGVRNPPHFPCWLLEGIVHKEVNRVTVGTLTYFTPQFQLYDKR